MPQDTSEFCRLILLRHPELDVSHAAVGAGPASLSRRGRAGVLRWLEALKPVAIQGVYSSDQPQCREAAAAVATHKGLDLVTETVLRDQDMGEWQGRAWEDLATENPSAVRDFFANYGEAKPPGGESLGEAVERVLNWWAELSPSCSGKTLLLVLPGSLIAGFTSALLGMRLSRAMSFNLPHGSLGVLDVFANGARLHAWNPDWC
jgi:broad specificity phosphatase PhoE